MIESGSMVETERSFLNTKSFIMRVYENAFNGYVPVDASRLDQNKPYTRIGDKFYQAHFAQVEIRPGEVIPLVMMPVDAKPKGKSYASVRRPNATLLYIFADQNDPKEPYQSLEKIRQLYGGVSRELIRQDIKKHYSDLYNIAPPDIQAKSPLRASRVQEVSRGYRWRFLRGTLKGLDWSLEES